MWSIVIIEDEALLGRRIARALESEGHARVLSSPKIATQNNERAEIEQGVRIPIVNTTATEIEVTFVSASLRLNVEPQITADDTIIMDVNLENNQPVFIQTVGDEIDYAAVLSQDPVVSVSLNRE